MLVNNEYFSAMTIFTHSSYDLTSIILNMYVDCTATLYPQTTYELNYCFIFFSLFSLNLKFINAEIVSLSYIDITLGYICSNKCCWLFQESTGNRTAYVHEYYFVYISLTVESYLVRLCTSFVTSRKTHNLVSLAKFTWIT